MDNKFLFNDGMMFKIGWLRLEKMEVVEIMCCAWVVREIAKTWGY